MAESSDTTRSDEADQLEKAVNVLLHLALDAKPCESGCPHQLTAHWTALGVANVVARTQRRIDREKKNLDDIEETLHG